MKLIYSNQNSMLVGLLKSHLEFENIATITKNDLSSGAAGELAPIDLWPELWVVNDDDIAAAEAITERFIANLANPSENASWRCTHCGETNDLSFEFCWHCESLAPEQAS